MDHHLKHAIRRTTKDIKKELSDSAIEAVKERVSIVINDKDKQKEWSSLINRCENADSTHYYFNDKENAPPMSLIKINTVTKIRHYYKIKDNQNNECWIDGMTSGTRGKIPKYSDGICLGAFLQGVHEKSIEGVDKWFKDHQKFLFNEMAKTLKWFQRDVIDYFEKDKSEKSFWKNKHVLNDLLELFYEMNPKSYYGHSTSFNKLKYIEEEIFVNSLNKLKELARKENLDEYNMHEDEDFKMTIKTFNELKTYFNNFEEKNKIKKQVKKRNKRTI